MNENNCLCCNHALRRRIRGVIDADTRQSFAIDQCSACGFGRTSPIPDNLGVFYQQEYHGGRHGVTTRICDRRRMRIVESQVGRTGGRRLLDVGCGDGTFLAVARSKGWTVVGTETHPERSRELGSQVVQSLDEAARHGPYDCVTMWHSLEHMSSANAVIESLAGLLSDGGCVVIAVPNYESWQARLYGRHWIHLDVPRHLSHFSMRSITHLAERNKFVATRLRQTEFEYDLMGWIQSGLNAVGLPQNLLLKSLMGRKTDESLPTGLLNIGLGVILGGVTLFPTLIGCWTGRGGTLVVSLRAAG